jgi:hypothetical protein
LFNGLLKVGDQHLPPGKAGAFRAYPDGSADLILRSNPNHYDVWHELGHYIHWKKIGHEAYIKLPRAPQNVPEQFVFDFLENHKQLWNRLTWEQQRHAVDYVIREGGIR